MYDQILQNLGLNKEQTQIYLSLLEQGPQTASQLAKNTPIKRTYVYVVIKSLATLGLATQETRGKITIFKAASPNHLLDIAEAQKQKVQQAYQSIDNLIPELSSKYALSGSRPIITYFEGIEGIKKIYKDTLNYPNQTLVALVNTSEVDPQVYDWLVNYYAKARTQANILAKVIVSSNEKTTQYVNLNQKELRETRIIDAQKYPLEHSEINIYGNKVAMIDHKTGSPLLGIIIENPHIATTFRSWFQLTWDQLT